MMRQISHSRARLVFDADHRVITLALRQDDPVGPEELLPLFKSFHGIADGSLEKSRGEPFLGQEGLLAAGGAAHYLITHG
jgi:hypothetical protein